MRIAIPAYPTPDSFADNVAHTLRKMGHEIITADRPLSSLGARYERLSAKLGWHRPAFRERWLLSCAEAHRPEIVLSLTQTIGEETLRALRTLGVRSRIVWWGDSPSNQTEMGLLTPEWDLICMKDPAGVAKLRLVGLNVKLLHEAMNPDWHRPLATQANESVVVAGNYYGYRQYLIRELARRSIPLALYGPRFPRWRLDELAALHTGRYVAKEEKSRVFGEGLACLNSTSFAEGNSLNCRAFEVAGAAGLQLIEDKSIIGECFEPGREVLVFSTLDELVGQVDRARRFPKEMLTIREAGSRRAHAHHTYQNRLEVMLRWAKEL